MSKVAVVDGRPGVVSILCPACGCAHPVATAEPFPNGSIWTYNGDPDIPTFHPSLLVHTPPTMDRPDGGVCHSFVTDGMIAFCTDSTHSLAGQTVPLLDFP